MVVVTATLTLSLLMVCGALILGIEHPAGMADSRLPLFPLNCVLGFCGVLGEVQWTQNGGRLLWASKSGSSPEAWGNHCMEWASGEWEAVRPDGQGEGLLVLPTPSEPEEVSGPVEDQAAGC